MYTRDINQRSYVDHFRHDGVVYEHDIYCADDDRVECLDRQGNVILTFTADCYVHTLHKNDPNKQQLGSVHTKYCSNQWEFWPDGDREKAIDLNCTDILKGEINLSLMYLKGELRIKPPVKEKEGA